MEEKHRYIIIKVIIGNEKEVTYRSESKQMMKNLNTVSLLGILM